MTRILPAANLPGLMRSLAADVKRAISGCN